MLAKLVAALVVAVGVTTLGVYFAIPEATTCGLTDSSSCSSAVESSCCSLKTTCPISAGEEMCSAATEGATATQEVVAADADALGACIGGATVAARQPKTVHFNCCED
jgi:hypothetical protein